MAIGNIGYGGLNPYQSALQKNPGNRSSELKKASASDKTAQAASDTARAAAAGQGSDGKTGSVSQNAQIADLLGQNSGPSVHETKEYGTVYGDVQLSDKARDYYARLKEKFGDMDFVLVNDENKEEAKANAGKFGTPGRTVVLIDESKIEKMASDPAYRDKYEGILQKAQIDLGKLQEQAANNPDIKTIGASVNDDGSMTYFTIFNRQQKEARTQQKEIQEKRQAEKAAEKKAERKQQEEKLKEKRAEEKDLEKIQKEDSDSQVITERFESNDLDDMLSYISRYNQDSGWNDVLKAASAASQEGMNFDMQA